jgi:hypothetical protein
VWCGREITHVTQNGSSETSNDTTGESDTKVLGTGEVGLGLGGHLIVDVLGSTLIDGELTNSVGDLLEEDGDKASVKRSNTLGAEDLREARDETVGIL